MSTQAQTVEHSPESSSLEMCLLGSGGVLLNTLLGKSQGMLKIAWHV